MTRHLAWLSLLSIALSVTIAAQDKPDFSGRWVLAGSAHSDSDVAQSLTVRQPIARTNVFGAPMEPYFKELTVERQFANHVSTETYPIGVIGGTVGGGGSQTRISVRWENDRLVIETGSYAGSTREAGPYTEHTEEWKLDAGALTISIIDRASDTESRSNTLTYRKIHG